MSESETKLCLTVYIKDITYESTTADEFVVLAFFLCFIFTAIAVILFLLYIIKHLKADKKRAQQSEIRRTIRLQAAKRFYLRQFDDDDDDSTDNGGLETNYVWSISEKRSDRGGEERSHSKICVIIDESKQLSVRASSCILEILSSLFTSSKNSSPPTYLSNCLWLRESCFELIKYFHHEAYSVLLNLMLAALSEAKEINEIEKLKLATKYEQMLDEDLADEEIGDSTCKLHCVLVRIEKDINEMVGSSKIQQENLFTGERLSKYLVVIQREMLSYQYDSIVKEIFLETEKKLIDITAEKWFNLEVIRYRINVVYKSLQELLKEKGERNEIIQEYLNEYLVNVYGKLNEFCLVYEKEMFDLISQVEQDKKINRKQAMMELEANRYTQRSNSLQELDLKKRKAVSKFVISQIELILNDFKTITNYELVVNSEGLELFEDFQKISHKRVVKLLRSCEEEVFDKLQKNEVATEENLVELGKALSSSLKDFKMAQEKLKVDFQEERHKSVEQIGKFIDSLYSVMEKNYNKGVEDMKKEYLEILHSLSNLQELEMNKLEHEFEIGFSCLTFSLYFTVMTGVVHKIHEAISDKIIKCSDEDVSLSLHDMVQILKQDKSVLNRSSLFQMPNKELYPIVEKELNKFTGSLSIAVENYVEAVMKTIDNFFLPQMNRVIQETIVQQSQLCVSNLYLAKEKLRSCSTNRKGYMTKQASSFAKDCFEQIRSIWESQANFKAHKLREGRYDIMKDFDPVIEAFFYMRADDDQRSDKMTLVQKTLRLQSEFFKSVEEVVRGNSVERVLDANLENELMLMKLHDKLESYEPRTEDLNASQQRNFRSQKSHDSDAASRRRKVSLRHSISRKNKKL